MPPKKKTTAQPNQSVRNGFGILEALAASDGPLTTGEIGQRLGLHPSVTSRLLLTLCEMGYVHRLRRGLWTPHIGLAALSSMGMRHTPIMNCIPILEEMRRALGLTVAIGMAWRGEVVYLFQSSWAEAVPGLGAHGAAQGSSIAQLLLADPMPDHFLLSPRPPTFTLAVPLQFAGQTFGLAVTNTPNLGHIPPPTVATLQAYARRIEALQPEG